MIINNKLKNYKHAINETKKIMKEKIKLYFLYFFNKNKTMINNYNYTTVTNHQKIIFHTK